MTDRQRLGTDELTDRQTEARNKRFDRQTDIQRPGTDEFLRQKET